MSKGRWPSLLRRTSDGLAEEEGHHLHDAGDITGVFGDVVMQGDIWSVNWNGGHDLSAGRDAVATTGYFLDSSAGAAQFKTIYADGGQLRTLTITGVLTLNSTGKLETTSGYSVGGAVKAVVLDGGFVDRLLFYSGGNLETAAAYIYGDNAAGSPYLRIRGPATAAATVANIDLWASALDLNHTSLTRLQTAGVTRLSASSSEISVVPALLTPATDNNTDLGTSTTSFKHLYAFAVYDEAGTLRLDLNSDWTCAGNITATGTVEGDTAVQAGSATGYGILRPTSNDATNTSVGFQGDPNTGLIRPGADRMRGVAGGTAVFEIEPAAGNQPGFDLLAGDPWIAGVKHGWCPVGTIVMYGGGSAPAGWVLCDGTAYSRTSVYDVLYGVIGTTFGTGDGSTTFNVPDLRQRFPLGKAAAGTGSTLGGTGGAIDHTHTGPSHQHSGPSHQHSGPSHTHGVGTYTTLASATSITVATGTGKTPSSTSHTHGMSGNSAADGTGNTGAEGTGNTGLAGTGATGSNNPPYQVVNFIIKY
jgi:microcystin-dependent protein